MTGSPRVNLPDLGDTPRQPCPECGLPGWLLRRPTEGNPSTRWNCRGCRVFYTTLTVNGETTTHVE
jgi:hypothetical protein